MVGYPPATLWLPWMRLSAPDRPQRFLVTEPRDETDDKESIVGLLKTAATAAVASSVHGRVQRRQQARWAAQDQSAAGVPAPAPPAQYATPAQPQQTYADSTPAPPAGASDRLAHLKQLGELLSAGLLTTAEFEQEKARILSV